MHHSPALQLLTSSGDGSADTLSWVTHGIRDTLSGIDFVSICRTTTDGDVATFGATDPLAAHADALQFELGEGPAVVAENGGAHVHSPDVEADERWQAYGGRVTALGIRSQMALELRHANQLIGVLNLYSTQIGPLPDDVVEDAKAYSRRASDALATAQTVGHLAASVTRRRTGTDAGALAS